MAGDPLDLRGRVARGLERRALALDAERAWLRSAARVARLAERYRGRPTVERWLDEVVDGVLLELAREADHVPGTPTACAVAAPLGIDAALARALLATFNLRAPEERRAFRELVIRGTDFDALGRRAVGAARRARATWLALLEAQEPQAVAARASGRDRS